METNSNNDLFKKGKDNNGIGLAVLLILIGGVYLLYNVGIIPGVFKSILISWQMLLIAIGLWSLLKKQYTAAVILILVGGIFIYPKLNHLFPEYFFYMNFDFKTYWPIILIIIGVVLIVGKFSSSKQSRKNNYNYDNQTYEYGSHYSSENTTSDASFNRADFIDKNIIFSGSRQIVLSQNFMGGDGNVLFGELIIDLRKAKLAKGTHKLEINTAFAGATVYVPSDWNVELQSSSIFGAFEDKRYFSGDEMIDRSSRLVIKASSIFGGGEIRN